MFQVYRNANVSLSEQIQREIADRIQSGLWPEGMRLPSVRELSKTIGVGHVTVVEAYQGLEDKNLILRVQGKGTFVKNGLPKSSQTSELLPRDYDWQLAIPDYLPRSTVFRQHTGPLREVPYQFSIAALEQAAADELWTPYIAHQFEANRHLYAQYAPVEGLPALRTAMCAFLADRDVSESPDNILITTGAQQAIDLVARTFVGPGDVVAVEAPTYPGALDVFRSRGATILPIPVDEEGMRVDLLYRLADQTPPKLIYTMPTYHNPTGYTMSRKRRMELLDLAEGFGALIVEDDSFFECAFEAHPKPLKTMDTTGHVIHIHGFSKLFSPVCRCAAVLATGSVRNRLVAAKSMTDLGSPVLPQLATLSLLTLKDIEARIREVTRLMVRKRDIVLHALQTKAPAGVHWTHPTGGYNVWVTLPPYVNTDELLIRAIGMGVSYLPGSACYVDGTLHHQIRISYSHVADDKLTEGLDILCALLRDVIEQGVSGHTPVI